MNTRKKIIKTVYKDEEDSENDAGGDYSDSGSEAHISEESASSEEDVASDISAENELSTKKNKTKATTTIPRSKCSSLFFNKSKSSNFKRATRPKRNETSCDTVSEDKPFFSVKNMTEEDKLLPSVLNLSDSESSDDETPSTSKSKTQFISNSGKFDSDSETESAPVDNDIWSKNLQSSEEIAKQTFMELDKQHQKIEEAKESIQQYNKVKAETSTDLDVNALLAQGEVVPFESSIKKSSKKKKVKHESESEIEDWEEVQESKGIPQQGIQLIVDFPDACARKQKKIDVEMMMRRKINRVKKEYQVYMHKVHVLSWIAHGNYVSRVLNDQEVMAAALKLVPSKSCYPGDRVDMKFVEQITTWFKDKLTLKQDKNEDKFKPKAPPLKEILLSQITTKLVTSKKYLVFIFICILRAMGLQCRVMFNFVTVPIRPPNSELCSLSTKDKNVKTEEIKNECGKSQNKKTCKPKMKQIKQLDGQYDSDTSSSDEEDTWLILQLDGSDDTVRKTRTRSNTKSKSVANDKEDVSSPKRARTTLSLKRVEETNDNKDTSQKQTRTRKSVSPSPTHSKTETIKSCKKTATRKDIDAEDVPPVKKNKPSGRNETLNLDKAPVDKQRRTRKSVSPSPTKRSPETTPLKAKTFSRKESNTRKKPDAEDVSLSAKNKLAAENVTPITDKTSNDKQRRARKSASPLPNTSNKTLIDEYETKVLKSPSPRKTRSNSAKDKSDNPQESKTRVPKKSNEDPPKIVVTNEDGITNLSSKYFGESDKPKRLSLSRKRSSTVVTTNDDKKTSTKDQTKPKSRTKSAPGTSVETSKYFDNSIKVIKRPRQRRTKQEIEEDKQRVSHRDLIAKSKGMGKNNKLDVTGDLVDIIKKRVREAKVETHLKIIKGKSNKDSDGDSDFLPEESSPKELHSESDCDFKPSKISPKPQRAKKKIDRRVLSTDDEKKEQPKNKVDVWCEIFVEELEQWISVDVIKARVHCSNELYSGATHPVAYVVGWDNGNWAKDVTCRYVPHWNTVTRKQRAETPWVSAALRPWRAPATPRDREEDEQLARMQLEAPLPTSIALYKNHPLYALQRHLLKFEAIYPPDAATLGFIRGQAVYSRDCVHTCRSRDTWLKEAKVVRLGEKPYKIVKARPKWDKLSNKIITDIPLEVFGPWQVQDYEPPTAENGVVPRNAYGNVELFKACMLPKKTVHLKLPGLNKVAKKLNIDCAPAMTGFDFNGGFTHPVFDGFVVCEEFKDILIEAWDMDQEEQIRKENEKLEARVYGNWKKLIKGLLIRERLKLKYGFQEPPGPSEKEKKAKQPKLVVKKR